MITVTIEAHTPEEFKEKLSAFAGMIDRCCQTTGPDAACDAPCSQAPAAEPETSTHDGVEYVDVVEEAPKAKRGRKKKEEVATEPAPSEEAATEPAAKADADPIADTLSMDKVQAELVKIREKVGVDAVRKLIADIGGQGSMLKDLPTSCYPDLLERARKLVAEAL